LTFGVDLKKLTVFPALWYNNGKWQQEQIHLVAIYRESTFVSNYVEPPSWIEWIDFIPLPKIGDKQNVLADSRCIDYLMVSIFQSIHLF